MIRALLRAAASGAVVWTAYGIVELFFIAVLPWMAEPRYAYRPYHAGFSLVVIALYAAAGAVFAGLFGLALALARRFSRFAPDEDSLVRLAALLPLIWAAFAGMAVESGINRHISIRAFACAGLTIVLLWGCAWPRCRRWTGLVTNPWSAGILLLGPDWLRTVEFWNRTEKVLPLAAGVLFVCAGAFLVQKAFARRQRAAILFVAVAACIAAVSAFLEGTPIARVASAAEARPAGAQPNVILISLDTVRADHLSAYGYERRTTPNLEAFAGQATLFTRALSTSDITHSSHASMFTGLYAARHGAYCTPEAQWGRRLSDGLDTLAEILSRFGYSTMAVVSNHGLLSHRFGIDQGFQYYDQRLPVSFLQSPPDYALRKAASTMAERFLAPSKLDRSYRAADEINQSVFELLLRAPQSEKPFYLFINYMDAHTPYIPPAPFNALFEGENPRFRSSRYTELPREVLGAGRAVPEEDRRHLESQYDGGIAYLDHHLGRLFARLRELDLYDNALIIVTSDHGESFGRRKLLFHGVSVYQDLIHVPLIIKFPRDDQGAVVDDPVSGVDILPTVLDVLGYAIPEGLDGSSLRAPSSGRRKTVFSESFPCILGLAHHPRFGRTERTILAWPWKFIHSTTGKRELYNLAEDPSETSNQRGTEAALAADLERALRRWATASSPAGRSEAPRDRQTLERLKSLGYLQ